jgi:hypothetical protein
VISYDVCDEYARGSACMDWWRVVLRRNREEREILGTRLNLLLMAHHDLGLLEEDHKFSGADGLASGP